MKAGRNKSPPGTADSETTRRPLSSGRRWVFRFVLLALLFLPLAAAELCLRLAGYGYNPDFFKCLSIGGADFFVQNEDFSLRFFPRELVRSPGPLRFPAQKAPGTFRIFILGESAAMGDPAESLAPDRYLEMMLREKYPGQKFEVINTAVTAINSHVILPIARECAARDGDLWIIYMGNNEMVGPFGAATVFGRKAPPLYCVRVATMLQKLRLGQCFMALGRRFAGRKPEGSAWRGMEMFLKNPVPPDSPARERVYQNFEHNLDDIVQLGIHSGATVLLNTVGVNLRDCPPFASLPGRALTPAEDAQVRTVYTNGLQAMAQQQWKAADAFFSDADRLGHQWAEFQYHWGECLLEQGNPAAAGIHFQLACDNDALPFRADSRINSAIQAEAKRRSGSRLIFCDAASALAVGTPTGICGNDTFFEHVHFDFDARYRLARAWAEQVAPLLPRTTNGWISRTECESSLGLSPWNRAQVLHLMVERMELPPLSSQSNNQERKSILASRIKAELARVNRDEAGRARQEFEKLVAQRPYDFSLHENYAVFLELSGDVPGATAQWERFSELLPQDSLGYFEAGRLRIPQQQFARAESLLRRAVAIRPGRTDGWIELGNSLAMQRKYTEALQCYDKALTQESLDPQTLLRRGKVLAHMNRHEEAIASYRTGLSLQPMDGLTHHELALELVAGGQAPAAGPEFLLAAQLAQDNVMLRFDYATWLLRQRLWPDAQQEFEAVLRLDPGNVRAQKQIEWLRNKTASGH